MKDGKGDSHRRHHQQNYSQRYKRNQANNSRLRRMGGPGILVTCETGREFKAEREGLEILNYYYYYLHHQIQSSPYSVGEINSEETLASKKILSLEEELAYLKSENGTKEDDERDDPKTHFGVYETGIRGTVFVLCSDADCPLIPPVRRHRPEQEKQKETSKAAEGGGRKGTTDKQQEEHQPDNSPLPDKKRARIDPPSCEKGEKTNSATEASTAFNSADDEEQENEKNSGTCQDEDETTEQATTAATDEKEKKKWDPLATVASILADLEDENDTNTSKRPLTTIHERKRNSDIPGSRYVSRMVPIQATCFSGIKEINETVKALVLRHVRLLKAPVPAANAEMPKSTTNSTISPPPPTTFSIKVKRRNCGHLKRDEIIKGVADTITAATATTMARADGGDNSYKSTAWAVNLRTPAVIIMIEVCKNLTGVSVLSKEYVEGLANANFNLAEIREKRAVGL